MKWFAASVVLCGSVFAVHALAAQQASEKSIAEQIASLRALPDAQRPAATLRLALEIRALPAGLAKLKLADALDHRATEGDAGREALQAVADTLAASLGETPQPAGKNGEPVLPYVDLARLVRYEGVSTSLHDPMFQQAEELLAKNDAEIERADFTLTDLRGRQWTLSSLRGKVVMVNFWATWCPPCRKEMPDLDALYAHFKPQGLVVLSISDEDSATVRRYLSSTDYHPPVLIDTGDKVEQAFHVQGIPKTFVFDREGRLVAQSIDMRTRGQFLAMLAKAGLTH